MYTYDDNGNLTIAEKQNSASVKQEKWVYSWNPRDQMTKAEKFTGTSDTYAGKVEYRYCLSCDSALSDRIEYSPTVSTTITSWKRYEYDGLNLLRVDERYDTGGGSIDANDPWRTLEVNTHSPGLVGNLLGKRAYRHTDNDATPNATYDYVYVYDAVGNLYLLLNDEGGEEYAFSQDAWGNELSIGSFYGTAWSSARTYGVSEHQTGKWIDPFTGLYFFHHRWYESGVGRWVSRTPLPVQVEQQYVSVRNSPPNGYDPDGRLTQEGLCTGLCAVWSTVKKFVCNDSRSPGAIFAECMMVCMGEGGGGGSIDLPPPGVPPPVSRPIEGGGGGFFPIFVITPSMMEMLLPPHLRCCNRNGA
ncbi:MAG: hypothetical protein GHCLOJNM_02346 [bacterium]|nr:hypothetical protein [bacterium]